MTFRDWSMKHYRKGVLLYFKCLTFAPVALEKNAGLQDLFYFVPTAITA